MPGMAFGGGSVGNTYPVETQSLANSILLKSNYVANVAANLGTGSRVAEKFCAASAPHKNSLKASGWTTDLVRRMTQAESLASS